MKKAKKDFFQISRFSLYLYIFLIILFICALKFLVFNFFYVRKQNVEKSIFSFSDVFLSFQSSRPFVSSISKISALSSPLNFSSTNSFGGRRLEEEKHSFAVETTYQGMIVAEQCIFLIFCFLSSAFLQWLVSKIKTYAPPVSIVWFVFGMIMMAIADHCDLGMLGKGIRDMRYVDSSVVYFIILPILLYEATQNISWHKFKKFLVGGLTLAVLGVALQVGILGVLFYYTFMYNELQYPWASSFLLASTLSSTDPVAVISVLHSVEAPDKLCTMFDGESLVNDGSAVLLFQFFFFLMSGKGDSTNHVIVMFIKLLFLGPLFGILIGIIIYIWMIYYRGFHLTQSLATIVMCYLGYLVAEYYLQLSGPLTAVCYGLFIKAYGHISLDTEAQKKHHHLVEGLGLMANSAIFFISGIVTYGMMSSVFHMNHRIVYWKNLIAIYLYLNVARAFMILIFSPILRKVGYGLKWKEAILLIWGGLRGGIVLALGLRIEESDTIKPELALASSFYVSGSVFLILSIHGMTFELLYRLLNPYPPKPFRRVYLEKVMKVIDYQYLEKKDSLQAHWLFRGTNILYRADKIVPRLGWRKLDRLGNLTIKAPHIHSAILNLTDNDIKDWVVPGDSESEMDCNEESECEPRHGESKSSGSCSEGNTENDEDIKDFFRKKKHISAADLHKEFRGKSIEGKRQKVNKIYNLHIDENNRRESIVKEEEGCINKEISTKKLGISNNKSYNNDSINSNDINNIALDNKCNSNSFLFETNSVINEDIAEKFNNIVLTKSDTEEEAKKKCAVEKFSHCYNFEGYEYKMNNKAKIKNNPLDYKYSAQDGNEEKKFEERAIAVTSSKMENDLSKSDISHKKIITDDKKTVVQNISLNVFPIFSSISENSTYSCKKCTTSSLVSNNQSRENFKEYVRFAGVSRASIIPPQFLPHLFNSFSSSCLESTSDFSERNINLNFFISSNSNKELSYLIQEADTSPPMQRSLDLMENSLSVPGELSTDRQDEARQVRNVENYESSFSFFSSFQECTKAKQKMNFSAPSSYEEKIQLLPGGSDTQDICKGRKYRGLVASNEFFKSDKDLKKKEKEAHSTAAIVQGLKRNVSTINSAFDLKYNLSLLENGATSLYVDYCEDADDLQELEHKKQNTAKTLRKSNTTLPEGRERLEARKAQKQDMLNSSALPISFMTRLQENKTDLAFNKSSSFGLKNYDKKCTLKRQEHDNMKNCNCINSSFPFTHANLSPLAASTACDMNISFLPQSQNNTVCLNTENKNDDALSEQSSTFNSKNQPPKSSFSSSIIPRNNVEIVLSKNNTVESPSQFQTLVLPHNTSNDYKNKRECDHNTVCCVGGNNTIIACEFDNMKRTNEENYENALNGIGDEAAENSISPLPSYSPFNDSSTEKQKLQKIRYSSPNSENNVNSLQNVQLKRNEEHSLIDLVLMNGRMDALSSNKTVSLASSESFFEIPPTPSRKHFYEDYGLLKCNRLKVLKKEREGELYLMVFNACREMYRKLYEKNCICGNALLNLQNSLDISADFAMGRVRQNRFKVWANAFINTAASEHKNIKIAAKKKPLHRMTGFEFEYSILQSRLYCVNRTWISKIPIHFIRSFFLFPSCQSDLEQILAFVDVHEELLEKGGRNMQKLLGHELLRSYCRQILLAKRFVLKIREKYCNTFKFILVRIAATLLLNLKQKLVKDQASNGLILEEDKKKILQIFEEQHFRLKRYCPYFMFFHHQDSCFDSVKNNNCDASV